MWPERPATPSSTKRMFWPSQLHSGSSSCCRSLYSARNRSGPPPAAADQSVQEMEVEVDEADVVADPVERSTEPGRRAPQPGELAVRGVEDVRHDEQHEPDEIGPAVAVGEQVTGHESDQDRPQRHLIG